MPAKQEHVGADRDGRVIDVALVLAAERGWDQVRFHLLAERTGMPMPEIGAAFRDVDAIADAWFARARLHLLALPEDVLTDQSLDSRIATACERWLDFLAPHRRVAAEILRGKLWPTHPHHWVPLVFNLSRLVHDMLDTARVPGGGNFARLPGGWPDARATRDLGGLGSRSEQGAGMDKAAPASSTCPGRASGCLSRA